MSQEQTKHLLLIWKHPLKRSRYVIGHLWYDRGHFNFRYEMESPHSLHAAIEDGFKLLDAFPEPDVAYSSSELFSTIAGRLPPDWRHDEYDKLGIDSRDPIEFLRLTGGRLTTDTLEFLQPVEAAPQSSYHLTFPVAGWRYYDGERAVEAENLQVGTKLRLELEPSNAYDPNAVMIWSPGERKLGYVPAIYSWYVDESVSQGDYEAEVERLGSPEDPQTRIVVRLHGHTNEEVPYREVPEGFLQYAEILLSKR